MQSSGEGEEEEEEDALIGKAPGDPLALPTELPENQTFLKAPIPDSCGKREKKNQI